MLDGPGPQWQDLAHDSEADSGIDWRDIYGDGSIDGGRRGLL